VGDARLKLVNSYIDRQEVAILRTGPEARTGQAVWILDLLEHHNAHALSISRANLSKRSAPCSLSPPMLMA